LRENELKRWHFRLQLLISFVVYRRRLNDLPFFRDFRMLPTVKRDDTKALYQKDCDKNEVWTNEMRKGDFFLSPRATVFHASLSRYRSQTSSKHILTIQPKQDLHNLTLKSRRSIFSLYFAVKKTEEKNKDITIDSSNQTLDDVDLLMAVKEIRSKVQLLQFTTRLKEQISAWRFV
jgi:hypothetical protein